MVCTSLMKALFPILSNFIEILHLILVLVLIFFPCNKVESISACSKNNFMLWHFRLSHLSNQRLRLIQHVDPTVTVSSSYNCDICPLAKQRKLAFPLSQFVSLKCFDLIHTDIWGPYKVPTMHGHQYFLTLDIPGFSYETQV